ncbi:EamA-like transporter family protein [Bisgaardia hudsonensis]|uniref:EamA-like transporter family protein n=1 Tax=Bisgaardia hudsonensis TaxID=109472 RepID=A0A4R2N196_9PAST|nr:DMT family transporter [Bisgaardia hudsonensis]QLB13134.1 hypothetical protein A6A11_05660 [Bisgaardia hudsonensis]TCP13294.1 EamA-like transporter family protein [Bisgaardia hudsonensis]
MKVEANYIYNLCYLILLGLGFPILRYMSLHFDVNNNNMVRFLSGGTLLLAYGMWRFYSQYFIVFKQKTLLTKVISLGILMTINMYLFIQGIAYTSATTASIFAILAMPISIGIAAFFYIDERQRVKQKNFYIGSVIAILASIFFVVQKGGANINIDNNFLLGAIFLFIAISIQGIQSLVIKSMNNQINAIVISSFTALIAGLINLFISVANGKIQQLTLTSQDLLLFALILAGIYGIATGMLMSFQVIQKQGIVVFNILQLIVPFFASIFAYIFLNETLTIWQILSGIIVIMSCMYALGIRKINLK